MYSLHKSNDSKQLDKYSPLLYMVKIELTSAAAAAPCLRRGKKHWFPAKCLRQPSDLKNTFSSSNQHGDVLLKILFNTFFQNFQKKKKNQIDLIGKLCKEFRPEAFMGRDLLDTEHTISCHKPFLVTNSLC